MFTKRGGHALVPYALEPHPDGSFDIDVYDSNRPFSGAEVTDGALHDATLSHSQIHIDPRGNWSFLMEGRPPSTWAGPPAQIHFVPMNVLRGVLTPNGAPNPSFSRVTSGASITQVTDDKGRSLFDTHGELVPEQIQPDVAVMTPLDQVTPGPAGTWTAPGTVLVLGSAGPYTETVAPGKLHILGAGVDGQVSTSGGGRVRFGPAAGDLQLKPEIPGPGSLELTHHDSAGQTTVAVSARLSGALSLAVGRVATVTAATPTRLSLKIQRAGLGRPPQTFDGSVRLGAGEKLELGSLRALDPSLGQIHATLSGNGRRRLTLTNRSSRPIVRIAAISTKRTSSALKVTVRLAAHAGRNGVVIVSVRSGRASMTVQATARSRMAVTLTFPPVRRSGRLFVWAVALNAAQRAGPVARRSRLAR
jgi:hypothetical protein